MKELTDSLPKLPGVYIFKDASGKIIYIGKAKILYNRVRSYFLDNRDIKTAALVKKIADLEYFVTNSEVEALILENNLIKKHTPQYNISLKDSKTYPYIKITKETIPLVIKSRETKNHRDEYFGPYLDSDFIVATRKIFKKILKLRSCRQVLKPPFNKTPCLNYHINQCSAPCAGKITPEDYSKSVDLAREFLKNNYNKILDILTERMNKYSLNMEYEAAAKIRDQIKIIESAQVYQIAENQHAKDTDYIGVMNDFNSAVVSVISLRSGNLIDKKSFYIQRVLKYEELLPDFIKTFYMDRDDIPGRIVIEYQPTIPEDRTKGEIECDEIESELINIETAIYQNRNMKVKMVQPSSLTDRRLLKLAKENSEIIFEEQNFRSDKIHLLRDVKKTLGLNKLPVIIEGFDVATLDGQSNVGAMVRFKNGIPDKEGYRKFNIKGDGHPDDYKMMEEMIARRYQRLLNEKSELPDLILVDGGKGQLGVAVKMMKALSLDIEIIGLAKKNEIIYRAGKKTPIILEQRSPVLRLIQRVRDESHRFSNISLKKLLKNKQLVSKLEEIEGIGKIKAKKLLHEFGSFKKMNEENISTLKSKLEKLKWLSSKEIERICHYFGKSI